MSQLQPAIELAPPRRFVRRSWVPGWLRLLLANPKSRLGLGLVAFMIVLAAIAPLVSVDDPLAFDIFATH